MSKYLVALYNDTDETIHFINTEHLKDDQWLSGQSMFTTKVHFNIPDNSDSSKYFNQHHMELQKQDGTPIFSFWDNDDTEYVMYYCDGTDWKNANAMPGYNPAGNETDIGIVSTKSGNTYELYSCAVKAQV